MLPSCRLYTQTHTHTQSRLHHQFQTSPPWCSGPFRALFPLSPTSGLHHSESLSPACGLHSHPTSSVQKILVSSTTLRAPRAGAELPPCLLTPFKAEDRDVYTPQGWINYLISGANYLISRGKRANSQSRVATQKQQRVSGFTWAAAELFNLSGPLAPSFWALSHPRQEEAEGRGS